MPILCKLSSQNCKLYALVFIRVHLIKLFYSRWLWTTVFRKPSRGIQFLVNWGFVEHTPEAVAKLLIGRRGLSKQMIGEYLGNLHDPFSSSVLEYVLSHFLILGILFCCCLKIKVKFEVIGFFWLRCTLTVTFAVFRHFINEINLHNMEIDVALRHALGFFRLPGEAQKIDRIMQVSTEGFFSR